MNRRATTAAPQLTDARQTIISPPRTIAADEAETARPVPTAR
jgi:hypothetical protein